MAGGRAKPTPPIWRLTASQEMPSGHFRQPPPRYLLIAGKDKGVEMTQKPAIEYDLKRGISQELLDRISSYRRRQKILSIIIFCSGFFWVWLWFLWVNKNVPHNPGGWLAHWIFFLLFTAMAMGSLFYLPFRLVRSCREDIEFFISLFPEEGPLICKYNNCNNLAVRNSAMCAKHHFEMVKHKCCPWEDRSKKTKSSYDSTVMNMISSALIACPSCQTSNPSAAKFCQSCGTPMLMPTLICPHCNTSNPQTAKYCINCGKHLAQILTDSVTTDVEKEKKIRTAHSFLSSLSVEERERLEKYSRMTEEERRKVCIFCEGNKPNCYSCASREEWTKKYMSAKSALS
ncbi:MAG: zinc ribbon domain-containing protein [Thermodesulfobacteriota bacterium]|nr:zinc ribbon domain-containing protein [Thermodesulfobacteriota bacterium]